MSLLPNNDNTRVAALFIAAFERSKGVFLSKASPVHDTKTVGIHKVAPLSVFTM